MMDPVDYQTGPAVCPKCGSSDQVRTGRELFDALGGVRDQAFQKLGQLRRLGQGPASSAGDPDDDYDHYNVEGSDPVLRNSTGRRGGVFDSVADSVTDDLGGAVLGFAGRTIGRRLKRAFEDKVLPAVEAKAMAAQQQWEQSKAEQDAIVDRYPELRTCLADQVVFLEGGYQTVPVSELKPPVTLAQADAVVARLR